MRISNFSRLVTAAVLGVCLMAGSFTTSAALILMNPSQQFIPDNASFYVDILAVGLPEGTSGGALDVSWSASAMTLDSVFLATTDPADSGGGMFPGPWDAVSDFLSGPGTIGPGSLTSLFVGSFGGVEGDQPIARLNFTLGTGVTNATIDVAAAAVGGTWSAWAGPPFDPYDFTNDYEGAVVNPVSVIPVPAAIWLFGSGVVGLAGVARRRS